MLAKFAEFADFFIYSEFVKKSAKFSAMFNEKIEIRERFST